MLSDDGLADGQAQAVAAGLAARFVDAVESLEDVWQVAWGNTDASIANRQPRLIAIGPQLHLNFSSWAIVGDRVLYEVGNHLSQLDGLAGDDARLKVTFDRDVLA